MPCTSHFALRTSLTLLLSVALLKGYSQTLTVTLTASDYNGYNVGCFGEKSGTITTTVNGGTAPYTYQWTNGKTTGVITDLSAGYYKVAVFDANNLIGDASITLTEPEALAVTADAFKYPTGDNISCFNCFNGSIDVTVENGVTPYTYDWGDGTVTQDRSGLGDGSYMVTVTDQNGCTEKVDVTLTQPERSDWTMNGNANTNPAAQYIGTSDNKDVVFKSNGQEALRLLNNGQIKALAMADGVKHAVYIDENGILKKGGPIEDWQMSEIPWYLGGNVNVTTATNKIGPTGPIDFIMITDQTERMTIKRDGKVGIGTTAPNDQFEVYTTMERSGISMVNERSDANAHTEIRFMKKENGNVTDRWSIGSDYSVNGGQDFFIWNAATTARSFFIDEHDRVAIGNVTFGNNMLYRLGVEGGIVCRDVRVTANNFPDYVFKKDYQLRSLMEVEHYINTNGHLPWFPSAEEVERNGGVEVGDMQLKLIRTVEEQMLYILELEKRIQALESRYPEPEPKN